MKNNFYSKLLPYLYSSLLYFIIYTPSIVAPLNKLSITNQFSQLNISSIDFHINSPTLYLLGIIYEFEGKVDLFNIVLILINFIFIIFIIKAIEFLDIYQYLFLASGWFLTSSWWIGYVDSILVFCTIILFKQTNKEDKNSAILFFTVFLLSFSHYVLAFFIILILIILQTPNLKDFFPFIAGYLTGIIINKLLLNFLNFDGVSRISYLIDPNRNIFERTVESISNNFFVVIFSAFMGMFFLLFIYSYNLQNIRIFTSLAIAIFVTSLSLDTTRIMSVLVVPVLLKLLSDISQETLDNKINIKYQHLIMFIGVLTPFIFPNYHVWDNVVYTVSPFSEDSSFFTSLINILNKFF